MYPSGDRARLPAVSFRVIAHLVGPIMLLMSFKLLELALISNFNELLITFFVFVFLTPEMLLEPIGHGQTIGHYIFGLQMVNFRTGKKCGPLIVILKYILLGLVFYSSADQSGHSMFALCVYEAFDFLLLLTTGATLTDNLLGVRVVVREERSRIG
jgi:hypothetical protein